MKKSLSVFFAVIMTISLMSQQNFTDFQSADMVIGQSDFNSISTTLSDSVTITPSAVAISSKGMLAVAEQKSGSIKIWYSLPHSDGQPADVEVGNPDFFT